MENKKGKINSVLVNGKKFISVRDGKWGAFFNEMGWDFLYRGSVFELKDGIFIPEFYFPNLGIYASVIQAERTMLQNKLCEQLSFHITESPDSSPNVIMLTGDPDFKTYPVFFNGGVYDDTIIVPFGEKYYPLYFAGSSEWDDYFTESTRQAIVESNYVVGNKSDLTF